jgi:CBS-domain-containing membrane protein
LSEVLQQMQHGNFGAMPVTDEHGRLVGIITDRDIAMAVARHHRSPDDLTAAEVMHEHVHTVEAHHDVRDAMRIMARHQVRRLPVIDESRHVLGLLSIEDLLLDVRQRIRSGTEPTLLDVAETLRAIAVPPHAVALQPQGGSHHDAT